MYVFRVTASSFFEVVLSRSLQLLEDLQLGFCVLQTSLVSQSHLYNLDMHIPEYDTHLVLWGLIVLDNIQDVHHNLHNSD